MLTECCFHIWRFSFEELIPILLQFVSCRQKTGRPVLWIAHNGRRFDVPFLIREFKRCSVEIPEDWYFLDTLYLARQLRKPDGIQWFFFPIPILTFLFTTSMASSLKILCLFREYRGGHKENCNSIMQYVHESSN